MYIVLLCFVLLWLYHQDLVYLCDGFTHILQGNFTGTGAIIWLPQCQWSNLEKIGKSGHTEPQQNAAEHKPYSYFMGYTLQPAVWYYVITLELTESKALCKCTSLVSCSHGNKSEIRFVFNIKTKHYIPFVYSFVVLCFVVVIASGLGLFMWWIYPYSSG